MKNENYKVTMGSLRSVSEHWSRLGKPGVPSLASCITRVSCRTYTTNTNILKFKHNLFFPILLLYECFACLQSVHMYAVPTEARRWHWTPWDWNYRWQ